MGYCNEQAFRSQFEFLKRQFLQDGGLPFTDVLSRETVDQALDTIEFAWNERIYTPLVTLWIFLGQVLSADHSCRNAVARLVVHRVSQGLAACSSKTGAYCQARQRLPEEFFSTITRLVGCIDECRLVFRKPFKDLEFGFVPGYGQRNVVFVPSLVSPWLESVRSIGYAMCCDSRQELFVEHPSSC